jgi:2-iminobutanoate/2-iminopropanoate deaminase
MKILCLSLMLPMLALAAQRTAVSPPGTPPGGTSSPGILSDGTLYVSGQTGEDPKTHQIPANFEDEMKNCLSNVKLVLQTNGMDFKNAVAVQVYLTDLNLFPRMNAVYISFFPEPRPARTTVGISKLTAPGAHIEITVTAHK